MKFQEEMRLRISRRTYKKEALSSTVIEVLQEFVSDLNRQSGLSLELIENGEKAFGKFSKSYGMFSNVKTLLVMKADKNTEHLEEKLGYYGEWFILEATRMNLGTCWVGGTFDKSVITLNDNEKMVGVIVVGPVDKETWKESLIRAAIHRKKYTVSDISVVEGKAPDWFYLGMEAALLAPSALYRMKTRYFYRQDKVMAVTEDEMASDRIDLGISKFHFACAAEGTFDWGNPATFHKSNEQTSINTESTSS